jgi:hypothetical protein
MIVRGYSYPEIKDETNRTYLTANLHGVYDWPAGEWRACPVGAALVTQFGGVERADDWIQGRYSLLAESADILRVDTYLLLTISQMNLGGYDKEQILRWLGSLQESVGIEYVSALNYANEKARRYVVTAERKMFQQLERATRIPHAWSGLA